MKPHELYAIKQVKVYQSVKFEGAECTFFTPPHYRSNVKSGQGNLKIERMEHGGVLITSDTDMIEIGVNNVAFIQYDMKSQVSSKPTVESKKSFKAVKAD